MSTILEDDKMVVDTEVVVSVNLPPVSLHPSPKFIDISKFAHGPIECKFSDKIEPD